MRVALVSGGKDSLYAAYKVGRVDLGVFLSYRAPVPSPHVANMGKAVETLGLAGLPVLVARLPEGRWREETVRLLEMIGAAEIVAGDVYVEDHLEYWESVAGEVGARLLEPLWGRDPLDLLYEIVESGFETLIIGVRSEGRGLLASTLSRETVDSFVEVAGRLGWDPLGERGEYHGIVTYSPMHEERLRYRVIGVVEEKGYAVARLA